MKTVATLTLVAVALMLPSSLSADSFTTSISYEHPFRLEGHYVFPGVPGEEEVIDRRYFDVLMDSSWDVPAFNAALGTVETLYLQYFMTERVTADLDPVTQILMLPIYLTNPIDGYSAIVGLNEGIAYPPGSPQFHWVIQTHPDSHALYDVRSSATFDILITGKAVATYFYAPTTLIPEPTTLLLLGSGLMARRGNAGDVSTRTGHTSDGRRFEDDLIALQPDRFVRDRHCGKP